VSEVGYKLRRLVLECGERLGDREKVAFPDMLERMEAGRLQRFSKTQKEWIEGAYVRMELEADEVENLFSTGRVPVGAPVAMAPVLANRPLKPPGRKSA